jgi:hypothetical protein
MAPPTKWQRQLKELAEAKKWLRIDVEIHVPKHLRDRLDDETEEEAWYPGQQYDDPNDSEAGASDQEGNSEDDAGEDFNITDVEDNLNLNTTAFEQIMGKKDAVFKAVKFKYQREGLQGQNRTRHLAVLAFWKVQILKQSGETLEDMSFLVARCYGRGIYFAWKLVISECMYLKDGKIPESRRGCYAKTQSWFNDEGIQLAVREWIAQSGEDKILHCRSGFELV